MNGYKRRKCVFIFLLFVLVLAGCESTAYREEFLEILDLKESTGKSQTETITMADIDEAAEGNDWTAVTANKVNFEEAEHDTYAYDSLTEAEKIWYEDINRLLAARSEDGVKLSQEGLDAGLTEDAVDKIYQCVLIDHPEYFYVDGYEYTQYTAMGKLLGIEVNGSYTLDEEECSARKTLIEEAVADILTQAPIEGSDYEKIKFVYEYIIFHTEYDLTAPDNQNIYSVFVGNASVCQGYAKATQYLLNRLGVDCTLVFGEVDYGEAHSWNMVKSGEEYYYLDTTWGDASYTANGELLAKEEAPDINYDYLCITSEQLLKTHTPQHEVDLPQCNATQDNYYIREGCYFLSYDEEQLHREFEEAFLAGKNVITLKCDTRAVYEKMYEELITNQKIFDYLDGSYESVAYIQNEEQSTLTFWVTK